MPPIRRQVRISKGSAGPFVFWSAVAGREVEEAAQMVPKLRWAAKSIGKMRVQFVMGLRKLLKEQDGAQ
jgi:hypothetical protein